MLKIAVLESHFEDTKQLCHSHPPDVTQDENSEIEIIVHEIYSLCNFFYFFRDLEEALSMGMDWSLREGW